jgi:formate hydrogenlyase subunit 4
LATLGLAAHSWNLDGILIAFATQPWYLPHPFILFTLISLGCVVLAENARYPVDNPATHLELTMVHEAMILEYSGPYLAMLELASAMKLTVMGVFFFSVLLPAFSGASFGLAGSLVMMIVKLVVTGVSVAFIETVLVKMRFYRMQEYMTTAYFLGLAGFVMTLIF